MRVNSNSQINTCGPLKKKKKKKKSRYSALSEERKEEIHRKQREAYRRKKSLGNNANRNKQIVPTSTRYPSYNRCQTSG
jgi:hypothetical protein